MPVLLVLLALREKPIISHRAVQPVPADQLGAQQVYGLQGPQPKPKVINYKTKLVNHMKNIFCLRYLRCP